MSSDPESTPADYRRVVAAAFGMRVRQTRKSKGMSLRALARAGQLDPGWLSQIEHGTRDSSISSVLRIAHGLDVLPEDLIRDLPRE